MSTPVPVPTGHAIAGIDSIPRLFVVAFEQAVRTLAATDLWQLHIAHQRSQSLPEWLPPTEFAALTGALAALAARARGGRYKLRAPERDEIVKHVGGLPAFGNGRAMFMLAWSIDDAFTDFPADHGHPSIGSDVMPVCTPFFDDISNAPPPLGQMRPVAICRRWFRHIHVCGRFDSLKGFGAFPALVRRSLPPGVVEALKRARLDERELRIALVAWRGHEEGALRFTSRQEGTFAVEGYETPARASLLSEALAKVRKLKAHIALLPEIALEPFELEQLQRLLRATPGRFPCLVAVGTTHEATGSGYVNEAVLLSSTGDDVLRARKTEPYYDKKRERLEDIVGTTPAFYPYVDTPVGRLVVNVCRDVRSDVPMVLNRAIGASLILVPTYSNRLDFVIDEARVLGQRQAAIVAAVNPKGGGLRDVFASYGAVSGCTGDLQELVAIDKSSDLAVQLLRFSIADDNLGQMRAELPVAV